MSLLVYEAIGCHINPTRWRQLVETAADENLNEGEKSVVADDLKHSSGVAKRCYRKRRSEETARNGKELVNMIRGAGAEEHTTEMAIRLKETKDDDVVVTSETSVAAFSSSSSSTQTSSVSSKRTSSSETIVIGEEKVEEDVDAPPIKIKMEEDDRHPSTKRFSSDEDTYLRLGIKKFGYGKWSTILRCKDYRFKSNRTSDGLRMRAKTLKLKKE